MLETYIVSWHQNDVQHETSVEAESYDDVFNKFNNSEIEGIVVDMNMHFLERPVLDTIFKEDCNCSSSEASEEIDLDQEIAAINNGEICEPGRLKREAAEKAAQEAKEFPEEKEEGIIDMNLFNLKWVVEETDYECTVNAAEAEDVEYMFYHNMIPNAVFREDWPEPQLVSIEFIDCEPCKVHKEEVID